MEFEKILSDLSNKVYHPVYFLMGEESYFIDYISDYIEKNVLREDEKEFNQTILYGGETNIAAVIATAKRYPMMCNYQVVIVKESQNIRGLIPGTSISAPKGMKNQKEPFRKKKDDGRDATKHPLELYLENPQKSTIIVFCYKYKTIDMRTLFAKNLSKRAVVLKSDSIYEDKVPGWIEDFVKKKKYSIEPQASMLLTEFLGNDLSKIANELEKLFINLSSQELRQAGIPEKSKITTDLIQKYIGISKEYNNFELQAAIGKRDVFKVNRIISYFASNSKDNPLNVTIASLYGYFSKILVYHYLKDQSPNNVAAALKVNPFFVKGYVAAAKNYPSVKTINTISVLREYDMRSKGIEGNNTDERELLKELVFRILH